jgi:hypothetical protein
MRVHNLFNILPRQGSWIKVRKVKVRKEHYCSACNGVIGKGEDAWLVIEVSQVLWAKYINVWYYHYDPNINPTKTSPNDYRKLVCHRKGG